MVKVLFEGIDKADVPREKRCYRETFKFQWEYSQ